MLLDKLGIKRGIDADNLGIMDARIMRIDSYKGEVTVDVEYLKQLEELAVSNLIELNDLRNNESDSNSIINQLKEENNELNNKLKEIKGKTNYIDLDYEALKLLLFEKALLAKNLEEELKHIKDNAVKVEYTKEHIENKFNWYLSLTRDMLKDLVPDKYINALQEIGALKGKVGKLEIDNKILAEKTGEEVKHSERIKNGHKNTSKSEVTKEVIEELLEQGFTKTAIAEKLKVSRRTIYNVLNRD